MHKNILLFVRAGRGILLTWISLLKLESKYKGSGKEFDEFHLHRQVYEAALKAIMAEAFFTSCHQSDLCSNTFIDCPTFIISRVFFPRLKKTDRSNSPRSTSEKLNLKKTSSRSPLTSITVLLQRLRPGLANLFAHTDWPSRVRCSSLIRNQAW